MRKEDREAQKHLAEAMNNLAQSIARFQDPIWFQKTLGDAFRQMASIDITAPAIARALPAGLTLEKIIITLSEEQKEELSNKIYDALTPQLKEFNQFVKDSLAEMPPHRLKELAERIDKGEKPKLQRRQGCIFVETDGGFEGYLGL